MTQSHIHHTLLVAIVLQRQMGRDHPSEGILGLGWCCGGTKNIFIQYCRHMPLETPYSAGS